MKTSAAKMWARKSGSRTKNLASPWASAGEFSAPELPPVTRMADEALCRIARIEAVAREHRDLPPASRERLPPHALLDPNDAAVLAVALRLLLEEGPAALAEALGLTRGLRRRMRVLALRDAILRIPAEGSNPHARARAAQKALSRYCDSAVGWRADRSRGPPTGPALALYRVLSLSGGRVPSVATLRRAHKTIFTRSSFS